MAKKSLAFKLNTSTIILLLFIVGISIYSALMMNKTQDYANQTGKNWLPSIAAVGELNRDLTAAPRRLVNYTLLWIHDLPKEEKAINAESLEKFVKALDDHIKNYVKLVSGPEE
jgi:methyl-accepting chemotaxis protein